jgi:DME family drug/metabolite transporter
MSSDEGRGIPLAVDSAVNRQLRSGHAPRALAVVAAACLFGTTGTARELGPDAAGVVALGELRLLVGAVTLVVVAGVTGWQPGPGCRRLYGGGGLAVVVFQVGFFTATDRTGVAAGTLVAIGSGPVAAGLIELARTRRAPGRAWVAATVLTVVGAALLVLNGSEASTTIDAVGVLAAIAAGSSYAAYASTLKVAIDRGADAPTALAATFATAAALLAPALLVSELAWVSAPGAVATVAYLGIVTLGLAYTLYGWGLERIAVPTVVTLTLAEPLTATVLGVVVLDEPIERAGWVGVLLVLAGLVLAGRSPEVADEVPDPLPLT